MFKGHEIMKLEYARGNKIVRRFERITANLTRPGIVFVNERQNRVGRVRELLDRLQVKPMRVRNPSQGLFPLRDIRSQDLR